MFEPHRFQPCGLSGFDVLREDDVQMFGLAPDHVGHGIPFPLHAEEEAA
jgi:hypothetical protein